MSQIESFDHQLSCPYFNITDLSFLNEFASDFESSLDNNSFLSQDFPTLLSDENELVNYPFHVNEIEASTFNMEIEDLRVLLKGSDEEESDDIFHQLSSTTGDFSDDNEFIGSIHGVPSLVLPMEDMEIDNQQGLNLLVKTYCEAVEMKQSRLAEVIVKRINEKVSPVGGTLERVLYHSFHDQAAIDEDTKQMHYLTQECRKVFEAAFRAIYQILPNGMLPHFTANSVLLEAMPHDVETIHIVDFDLGEGVQWPSMIVSLAQKQPPIALKLTSIKCREENCNGNNVLVQWRFEETKRRLHDHARCFGLKLKVEEIESQNLVTQLKLKNKRGERRREWLAFNCMWALPHMGRRRRRSQWQVMEFIGLAKDCLANNKSNNYKGIITFCEGDAWKRSSSKSCPSFGSFYKTYMKHHQALFESLEGNFPICEARIAMETLFLAPQMGSLALVQQWREIKEGFVNIEETFGGLQGWRVSNGRLMEAREMVKEGKSWYKVSIEGQNSNIMVLEWRGTPLVKFSAWR